MQDLPSALQRDPRGQQRWPLAQGTPSDSGQVAVLGQDEPSRHVTTLLAGRTGVVGHGCPSRHQALAPDRTSHSSRRVLMALVASVGGRTPPAQLCLSFPTHKVGGGQICVLVPPPPGPTSPFSHML